ncbi:MAG: F0F1 ATP synthase subunit A [Bacteroidota bacterium]
MFLLIFFCFWWLPFSFLGTHRYEKLISYDLVNHLIMHLADEYALHFGEVVISLPMILYTTGEGWKCFSSSRLLGHGEERIIYKGFYISEEGILIHKDDKAFYDFSITKNVVMMILAMCVLCLLFTRLASHLRKRSGKRLNGFWLILLYLVRFVRNDIAREIIGPKHYERFTPYLLTIFCYILLQNILGLLPNGANVTGNIYVTATLALFTFITVVWNGTLDYWAHIFAPPEVPLLMYPILVPIEIIGQLIKPALLAIRLCANMFLGHMVLIFFVGAIFLAGDLRLAGIVVPISAAFTLLKIFVSFIQAQIFTVLSAVLIAGAVEKH